MDAIVNHRSYKYGGYKIVLDATLSTVVITTYRNHRTFTYACKKQGCIVLTKGKAFNVLL